MRQTGKSKTCVWRWQERFIDEGVDGLLRDKTRPSRIRRLGPEVAERVVALTLDEPPGEDDALDRRARWRRRPASASVRCSASGAPMGSNRIASASSSCPTTREFVDKLRDIVGLYVDPPAHAVVLSRR